MNINTTLELVNDSLTRIANSSGIIVWDKVEFLEVDGIRCWQTLGGYVFTPVGYKSDKIYKVNVKFTLPLNENPKNIIALFKELVVEAIRQLNNQRLPPAALYIKA